MLTREEVIRKVQLFTQEILSSGVPLERVILFGSYAKNKANNDSDIDVALVSTIFNGFGYEDRKHFSKINIKKYFVDIETKTFPSAYFECQGRPGEGCQRPLHQGRPDRLRNDGEAAGMGRPVPGGIAQRRMGVPVLQGRQDGQ